VNVTVIFSPAVNGQVHAVSGFEAIETARPPAVVITQGAR
jgi:hypothetical protein